jgi:hypothetical protein
MDSSIKSLTITGTAVEDANKSRQAGKSRKRREIVKDDETEFLDSAKKFVMQQKIPEQKPVITQVQKPVITQVQSPLQKPLTESTVILKPPKQARVKLQPKLQQPTKPIEIASTRKARRIRLHVANLTHRFTRAKRVKDDTNNKPTEEIRKYLVEKQVIQANSKAPEKMLRSMYADFMLLKDQAL